MYDVIWLSTTQPVVVLPYEWQQSAYSLPITDIVIPKKLHQLLFLHLDPVLKELE